MGRPSGSDKDCMPRIRPRPVTLRVVGTAPMAIAIAYIASYALATKAVVLGSAPSLCRLMYLGLKMSKAGPLGVAGAVPWTRARTALDGIFENRAGALLPSVSRSWVASSEGPPLLRAAIQLGASESATMSAACGAAACR